MMIEDIIGASLIHEEVDSAMVQDLVKGKVPEVYDRVMKSYKVSGKDIGVLTELNRINGAMEGVKIEQGILRPAQLLSQV